MVADGRDGELAVPPTIQALLAARLDRLAPDERDGRRMRGGPGPGVPAGRARRARPEALAGRLAEIQQSLVRKDLVRPAGEDTFRFKHLLLRDAAYEALPKEQRAELHERFADWIDRTRPELEEILGYHLEQAYRLPRASSGPSMPRAETWRGGLRPCSLRRQARGARADVPATINLLERAVKLLPDGDAEAVAIYPDLGTAVAEGRRPPPRGGSLPRARELGDHAPR